MKAIATLEKFSYLYPSSPNSVLKDISRNLLRRIFRYYRTNRCGENYTMSRTEWNCSSILWGTFFGHITVAGKDTLECPISELARYVGMVFEDPEMQLTSTSVENEIAFALENLCVPRDEIIKRIPQVLEAVRLEGCETKNPQELSGGQKQRLAIAATLALQPALLILDEPTSQLDPIGSEEVFATVKELNQELGISIVMVSHAS